MSFRNGAYANLWEHSKGKGNYNEGRISTSKKYKGEYENDFSGFVRFVADAKDKVAKLSNERHRIKIISCEVTNRYDKEKKKEYVNYAIFDFELADDKKSDFKAKEKTENIESKKSDDIFTNDSNEKQNGNGIDLSGVDLSKLSPEQITALMAAMKK